MISLMENIERPDADDARAALSQATAAGNAVRNTPWPSWLYPINAALVIVLGLTLLVERPLGLPLTLATSAVMIVVNWLVARRLGVLYALPTSRTFLTFIGISAACLIAIAVCGALFALPLWAGVSLTVAAGLSYLFGCLAHYRSTRPAQPLGS